MVKLPDRYELALDCLEGLRFPKASLARSLGRVGSGAAWPDNAKMVQEADAYREELAALPREEVIRRAEEHWKREAEKTEAEAPYNQPWAMTDLEHWSRAAYWTLDEAVWLMIGRDPRRVQEAWFKSYPFSPFLARFKSQLDLARRAKAMGQLLETNLPGFFIAWAKRNRMDFPRDLEEAVIGHGHQVADWKTQCDEALAALQNARDKLAEFSARIEDLRGQLTKAGSATAEAEAERDRLRHELGEQLETRPKETLLKMLIGMAVGGYAHKPEAARNATATDIASDLARLGIPVSDDTIRKWLAEAAELLPPRETE